MPSSRRPAPGPASQRPGMMSRLQRWSGFEDVRQPDNPVEHAEDSFSLNGVLTVLVVDDNPNYRKMASDALEQCGISAVLASDGAEAVLLSCERSFGVILMDLQMPVMDGITATSRIRQCEQTCCRPRTPVVAYSTAEVSMTLLTANGLDDRLNKPCSALELEACLLRWCDGFQPWFATGGKHAGVGRPNPV